MTKMKALGLIGLALLFLLGLGWQASGQSQKPNYDKIVGTWSLEVNAGNEYYYLTLELAVNEGKLAGKLSEQSGMFKDAPLLETAFDGQTLNYSVKIPTPPDGAERLVKSEMKLADNKLDGAITVQDLEITAPVTGTKK
jgi:hypothetical protein